MKNIAILGSTGSIGTQTLEIVRSKKDLNVVALSCGRNVRLLEAQIREFKPSLAAVWSEEDAADLRIRLADMPGVRICSGMDGLIETAVCEQSEILVTAIVGMLGIRPTIAAIEAGKDIALANKETLVTAGSIIMPLAEKCGVRILPVDSEHSAIFQSLQGNYHNRISRILLTASGGPFRGFTREQLAKVRLQDALKHPNWSMGAKITVDSSTMVNKGLEVMEAKWLFNVDTDRITVLVHPQSILHSAVEYEDGAVIAQLGVPDMKLPIQYALYYPDRLTMPGKKLDLFEVGQLTFERPDPETFEGLKLAYRAINAGDNMPTVFNAANEKAVGMFLKEQIDYLMIPEIIGESMAGVKQAPVSALDDILATESATYEFIERKYGKYSK